jgi:hypothetical protein
MRPRLPGCDDRSFPGLYHAAGRRPIKIILRQWQAGVRGDPKMYVRVDVEMSNGAHGAE